MMGGGAGTVKSALKKKQQLNFIAYKRATQCLLGSYFMNDKMPN